MMPIKNILITEPTNPVLRQLGMLFLQKPGLRLACFGQRDGERHRLQKLFATGQGQLQSADCEEIPVDEIWHTTNPADSMEECKKKTEKALLCACRQKDLIFHYVSASTVSLLRRERPSVATARCSNQEQKHLLNEISLEQSGCKFRIYRIPLGPEEFFHSAVWQASLIKHLARFKPEIEDRIPGYFAAQPLRLCLPKDSTIDIARIDDVVQAIEQILSSGMDGPYFHISVQPPRLLKECLRALAQSVGMRLQVVSDSDQQNYIDRLFGLRMERFLAHLERSTQLATAAVPESSPAGAAWINVPPISLQDFIAAYGFQPQSATEEIADWKSGFRQEQVLLPEGVVLNYYAGGKGKDTLVLLNAYGQSFQYWERLIQAVSPHLRVILWIPRGNDGDTIGLNIANSQAVHAGDLEKVLQQEEIRSATLLAWCSGPKLALEFYQRCPGRVSSMVFVAGSFKGLQQHKTLETDYEKNLEPLLEAIEKYPETADVVLEYLKGILLAQGKQARGTDELAAMSDHDLRQALSAVNVSLQDLVLHPFHAANVVAYARQMCNFWEHDFVALLDKVDVPVLFVGGDCDRIASQAIAKVVAGMMPKAKYLEVKGGTHYVHYDQWDLLAEVTQQFINSGSELEFSTPWAKLAEFYQEPVTAGQN